MKKQTSSPVIKELEPVKKELKQVQNFINRQISSKENSSFERLVLPLQTLQGKMVRPALLLLSGKCCGKITQEHIKAAAVVEMLHNATLLHDDVIDEGSIRRGLPTANKLYGNEKAVLLGDFLLSKILLLCSGLNPQINEIMASTTVSLCRGELTQIANKRNWDLSEKKYIEIISEKTASLFRACCLLGAVLSG